MFLCTVLLQFQQDLADERQSRLSGHLSNQSSWYRYAHQSCPGMGEGWGTAAIVLLMLMLVVERMVCNVFLGHLGLFESRRPI